MKTVKDIRSAISPIPGAMYEIEAELSERGKEFGVQTLWEFPDPLVNAGRTKTTN